MSGASWVRPPLNREPAAELDAGPSVPSWVLSAAALVLSLAASVPMLELGSVWILLPLAAFILAAARPSVGATMLALFFLLAGVLFTHDGVTGWTFVLVLTVHVLFVLYSATAAVPRRARITTGALHTLGVTVLKIQLAAQPITLLALLTAQRQSVLPVALAACAAVVVLVLVLSRAADRTS